MASVSGNGARGHHKFTLEVTQKSQSILNNTSTLSFTFKLSPISTSWNWEQWGSSISYTVTIAGTKYTGTIPAYDGYSTVTLKSATQTVSHATDGTKSIAFSFSVNDATGQTYTCGNASGSGTMTLTKIPRYATSNQSLHSKEETSVKISWSSDSTVDYVWYSKDNGSNWIGVYAPNSKSGMYTISGLSANTSYNIKTRVRRKDSQLTTDSSKLSVTTYNYPYCNNMPNFTIGEKLTIRFYNPLNRSISWKILGNNDYLIAGSITTGTSYTGITSSGSIDNLYASIPNAQSSTYKVKVTYEESEITKTGGKYKITGTETPSTTTVTYADTNSTVTAITGNNQQIVQNQSNLKVTYTDATAKNGATIKNYTFVLNGVTKTSTSLGGTVDFGKVDSASNLTLTATVTDSRGLTATTTKTITVLAHSDPTAVVTLERLNNYEDETYLTVDGSISSVNSKNTMAIKYRYKTSGGSYGSYVTISDNAKQTLSLNKNNAYIFEVVVTDAFGSTYIKEHALGKGVFPLFIDTKNNSVGINALPTGENLLEVGGTIVEHNREFSIPTSSSKKTGWYLAFSGTMGSPQSRGIMVAIQQTYNGSAGIFYFNLRCESSSSTLSIKNFHWLTYSAISSKNICLKTDGKNFYLYLKVTADYQQYYLKIIQEKNLGGKNYNCITINKPTTEDTVEEPTGTNPTDLKTLLGIS